MRHSRGLVILGAAALSLTTYLIPLLHIESDWHFVGSVIAGPVDFSALTLAWLAVVLLLQFLAFLLFYWILIRFRWVKVLAIAVLAPVFVAVANFSLLYAVPLLVLVERETKEEIGVLEQICRIPDAAVAQVHSGTDLAMVRAEEVWLATGPERALARLTLPGCDVRAHEGLTMGQTIDSIAPGGHFLRRRQDGTLHYFGPGDGAPMPVPSPADVSYWNPILSDDGQAVIWLDRGPADGAREHRLRTRSLTDGSEQTVTLTSLPQNEQYTLIGARTAQGPFSLAQFPDAVISVDLQGNILGEPVLPGGIDNTRWGFRWLNDGWVAWDGYREAGRSRVVWDLANGRGTLDLPKGRRISSLSVSADGRMIALSTSSNLRIGDTPSAIIIFRTNDGEEIYRRYQGKHIRSNLAFLGSRHLAVTRFQEGREFVEVVRLPAPSG